MFDLVAALLAIGTGVTSGLLGVWWARKQERKEIERDRKE